MHHTQLLDANLSNADLSGADLVGADLTGASLSRAKLSGADFSDANLSGTDLSEANLTGAYWVDGKRCKEGSIGECKGTRARQRISPGRPGVRMEACGACPGASSAVSVTEESTKCRRGTRKRQQ